MQDIRHVSKEFLTEFINIYRAHPALWKIKSREYVNRNLKNVGYDALVEFYRLVDPHANRDIVSKKIQSLRGSFRKELKKYEQSKINGDENYVPSLWYFDLLMFTRDQELSGESTETCTVSNGNGTDEEEEASEISRPHEEARENGVEEKERMKVYSHVSAGHGEKRHWSSMVFRTPSNKKIKKSSSPLTTMLAPEEQQLIQACTDALKCNMAVTESDAFGNFVAAKHAKLSAEQRLYAETLISIVLNKGILEMLSEQTAVVDQKKFASKHFVTSA